MAVLLSASRAEMVLVITAWLGVCVLLVGRAMISIGCSSSTIGATQPAGAFVEQMLLLIGVTSDDVERNASPTSVVTERLRKGITATAEKVAWYMRAVVGGDDRNQQGVQRWYSVTELRNALCTSPLHDHNPSQPANVDVDQALLCLGIGALLLCVLAVACVARRRVSSSEQQCQNGLEVAEVARSGGEKAEDRSAGERKVLVESGKQNGVFASVVLASSTYREHADAGLIVSALAFPLELAAQVALRPDVQTSWLLGLLWHCSTCSLVSLVLFATQHQEEDQRLQNCRGAIVWRPRSICIAMFCGAFVYVGSLSGGFSTDPWYHHILVAVLCGAFLSFATSRMPGSFTMGEMLIVSNIFMVPLASTLVQCIRNCATMAGWPVLLGILRVSPESEGEDVQQTLVTFCESLISSGIILGAVLCPSFAQVFRDQRSSSGNMSCGDRSVIRAYVMLAVGMLCVVYPWVWLANGMEPVAWMFAFLAEESIVPYSGGTVVVRGLHAWMCVYWALCMVLCVFIFSPKGRGQKSPEGGGACGAPDPTDQRYFDVPNIVIRKYYHLMALYMFVPSVFLTPKLLPLAFCVAIAVFLLVEYLRIAGVPPLGTRFHHFMKHYLDTRDSGVAILTHIYLLLGCAIPLWFSSAVYIQDMLSFRDWIEGSGSPKVLPRVGPLLAGIVILGVGDSIASLVGSMAGRLHWPSSLKTVEGSLAAVIAVFFCMSALQWASDFLLLGFSSQKFVSSRHMYDVLYASLFVRPWYEHGCMLLASIFVCLLEAFTLQIDNLVLPIYFGTVLSVSMGAVGDTIIQ